MRTMAALWSVLVGLAVTSCAANVGTATDEPSGTEEPGNGEIVGPRNRPQDRGGRPGDGQQDRDPGGFEPDRPPDPAELPEELLPCAEGSHRIAPVTIFAVAPFGTDATHLGRPVDEQFEMLSGPDGASLLPDADVHTSPMNTMEHRYLYLESSRQFSANASLFGISANVEDERTRRHAIFSAYELDDVREIDDTGARRIAPNSAKFYIWRVYYGHSYQMMVSGSETRFHEGVRARFSAASGGIEAFAQSNHLTVAASGRGLTPSSGEAIFARTQQEIENAYSTNGDAVPIFVEYRSVSEACLKPEEEIPWLEPTMVDVRYDQIYVYKDGSVGADTWSLDARCSLDGEELFLDDPVIWEMRQDVCDSEHDGVPGPNGDGNYCQYNLGWSARIEAIAGQTLTCGIEGMAWDNADPVDYSEFRHVVGDAPSDGRMGAGNSDTEYWLFYSIAYPD